jgi:signal transduction histidine kinase
VALNNPNEIHTRLRSLRVKEFAEHNLLILDIHQQQHLSVLLLGDKLHKQGFVEREIQQLLTLAKVVAVAIDNARRFANAQRVRVDQRELLRALINAQEHESKLVADAWRERVGAELFAVLQGLRSFHMLIARRVPESQERFEQLIAEIDVLAALVRGLTDELHPVVLDDFGFVAALREYVAGFDEQESFRVIVHTEGEDQHLPNETGLTLFRVTQEALRNVRKHARAKNVQIAFVQEHAGVSLMIKDDGQGFNPEQQQSNHFGLLSMRERVEACGGTFRVLSSQGQGTEVRVSLPDKRQSPARLTHRLSS